MSSRHLFVMGVMVMFCATGITARAATEFVNAAGENASIYFAGSGTVSDPYLISNVVELVSLADLVNDGTTDADNGNALYSTLYYKLTASFSLSGEVWVPIGTNEGCCFSGCFDGNGQTLTALAIGSSGTPETAYPFAGLFGFVKGMIKDVTLSDASIYVSGGVNAGVLAGRADAGRIIGCSATNCSVQGSIAADSCGSLAGYASSRSLISDCHADRVTIRGRNAGGLVGRVVESTVICDCSVTEASTNSTVVGFKAGGLVGSGNFSTVAGCSVFAVTVTGENPTNTVPGDYGYCYAGGLMAECVFMTIEECSASGTVSGVYAGGLIGDTETTTVSDSTAAGAVVGSTDSSGNGAAGGFVGWAIKKDIASGGSVFKYCSSSASVNQASASGNCISGGFAGYTADSEITDCSGAGNVGAATYAGGFIGCSARTTIADCSAGGSVGTASYGGGFAGYLADETIQTCSATGTTIAAGYYVGGFAGYVAAGGRMVNCYATCNLTDAWVAAGGVGGYVTGSTIDNCYYSKTVGNFYWAQQGSGVGGVVGGLTNSTIAHGYCIDSNTTTVGKTSGSTNDSQRITSAYLVSTNFVDELNTNDVSADPWYYSVRGPVLEGPSPSPAHAPTASDVEILSDGSVVTSAHVGDELLGSYTFYDDDSDAEGMSLYGWYRSDDASGSNKTVIGGAVGAAYIPGNADVGKYISFVVQPIDEWGVVGSNAVESAAAVEIGARSSGLGVPTNSIITTVAGNGTNGYSGDGAAAVLAQLQYPYGVDMDDEGNLFIADSTNHCIRRVDTNGTINTVAGTGTGGYNGDGIAATSAQLNSPTDVAVDDAGNLFIADTYNHRIRRVDTNGMISTVVGTGTGGYAGDGEAAVNAKINYPRGITMDDGNLFIADTYNHRIRRVDTNDTISTVAGMGAYGYNGDGIAAVSAELNYPVSVTIDRHGDLLIADRDNHRIRRVDHTDGIISTLAGTGLSGFSGDSGAATLAQLNHPSGMACDTKGNLFISDCDNQRIRRVDVYGTIGSAVGTGTAGYNGDGIAAVSAQLNGPHGLTLDGSNNLYIADTYNQRVRRVEFRAFADAYPANGPCAGGNSVMFTNCIFGSITNVLVDGVTAMIVDSGTNWVTIIMPFVGTNGAVSIVVQTSDNGDTTLTDAYTYNPAGEIADSGLVKGRTYIAGGFVHSLGLKSDGTIVGWGDDAVGQITIPAPNTNFVAVSAGYAHSLGLKSDGTIVAWGSNGLGQTDVPAPNTNFVAVSAGAYHSLGLKSDGMILAWGDDSTFGVTNVPAPNTNFVAVSAGAYHSLGLKSDGTVVGWGKNYYGQTNVPAPNTNFVAVAAGGDHSLGLKSDGTIVGWGDNSVGQITIPAPNTNFVAVSAGGDHSLGLKSDGTIVAWGYNYYGQTDVPAPNTNFVAVAAGDHHSLGLKSDGTIVTWGRNNMGQTSVPAPNADFGMFMYGVLPFSGSWTGGYPVVITGTNLGNGADITNVTLCGVSVTSIDAQSATQIVVTAAQHVNPGVGDVVVYSTSYGITTKSNAFTYEAPGILVLCSKGMVVTNGAAPWSFADTSFWPARLGLSRTNTFGITNNGTEEMTISGFGISDAQFAVSDMPASVGVGCVSNFSVTFTPTAAGDYSAALTISNDSPSSVYVMNFAGSCFVSSTNVVPLAGGNLLTVSNGYFGDITNVVVAVGEEEKLCQIAASGTNWFTIIVPPATNAGEAYLVVQTTDNDFIPLFYAYTYNPAGQIGGTIYGPCAWTNMSSGVDDTVNALANDGTNLYAGGWFYEAGGTSASCIAKWDSASGAWTNLSSGLSTRPDALVYNGTDLYAGGWFSEAGGVSALRVAKWDTVSGTWTNLGSGVNSPVYALAHDGTILYAGGTFTTAGVVSVSYVAMWDAAAGAWTNLGSGMNGSVISLLHDGVNLYAGGTFTTAGGVGANRIAKWDGTSWTNLGSGLDASAFALVHDGTNLYAGGFFTNAGGVSANYVAMWDGASWTNLGSGMNDAVYALAHDGTNLYVGGSFTNAGDAVCNYVAKWNPAGSGSWTNLSSGMDSSVDALTFDGVNLYAGGTFLTADGLTVNRVAKWGPDIYEDAGVAPASGSWTGNYPVVITGTNLGNGADITNVTLCGVSALIQSGQSSTQVVVLAGQASTPGIGDVVVYSTSYGETVKSNAFTYTGAGILVSGSAFAPVTPGAVITNIFTVTNSGTEALLITAVTNDGVGSAYFDVSAMPSEVAAGTASNFPVVFTAGAVGTFNPTCYPVNNSTVPDYSFGLVGKVYEATTNTGPYAGGNTITISNGTFGTITNVLVGGVAATITTSGTSWVTIIMPSIGTNGTVDIVVQTSDHGDTTLPNAYTYNAQGVISPALVLYPFNNHADGNSGFNYTVLNSKVLVGSSVAFGPGLDWYEVGTDNWSGTNQLLLTAPGADIANANAATALSSNWYFGITVTPNSTMDIGSIEADWSRGGSAGVRGWFVRSSLDNYTTDLYTNETPNGTLTGLSHATIDLTGFTGLSTSVTFRFYIYTESSSRYMDFQHIQINGPDDVVPVFGSWTGHYPVAISGLNLGNGSDITNVTLCGVAATISSQTVDRVWVTAGVAQAAGMGDIVVQSASYGETVKSSAFTYLAPTFVLLGTNEAVIANSNATSTADGTDFGSIIVGSGALTNTFSITNSGNILLTISGIATDGVASAAFQISDFKSQIGSGSSETFQVIFTPQGGVCDASFTFTSDSTDSPFILNVRGTGLGGGIDLSTNALTYTATYGGSDPTDQSVTISNKGISGMAFTNQYTAAWLSVSPDSGSLATGTTAQLVHSIDISGLHAGTYTVTNQVSAADATNSPQPIVVSLVVDKADQAISFSSIGRQNITNTVVLSATASSGLPVTFSVVSGPAAISGGTNLTFTDHGMVTVRAAQAGTGDWEAALAQQTFRVTEGGVYLDFDGDGLADIACYYPDAGMWYILQSGDNTGRFQAWGWNEAVPVPGDYDGDGLADVAVYAPECGAWHIWLSDSQTNSVQAWGFDDAWPVPGDYDGDGICDLAVYTPETGMWSIWQSATQTARFQAWGYEEAEPVPADYDGDGLCDLAVYVPETGTWLIWQSATETARSQAWGWDAAWPVPGDYDGDGLIDVAVYNPASGFWLAWLSASQSMMSEHWGWNQALPVPADYDGDGKYDRSVYAPSYGMWYLWQSASQTMRTQLWGFEEAYPVR